MVCLPSNDFECTVLKQLLIALVVRRPSPIRCQLAPSPLLSTLIETCPLALPDVTIS